MNNNIMRIANASNGLAFPPYEEISMFLSTHGHHYKDGYFRIDAMPYKAVVHLLKGNIIKIVDATPHNKPLCSSFKNGITTWCLVFNRAIGMRDTCVAPWQTIHHKFAANSDKHRPTSQRIRRLSKIFGYCQPAVIGENVILEMHYNFDKDDKPELIIKDET